MGLDPRAQAFKAAGIEPLSLDQLVELRGELVCRLDQFHRRMKSIDRAWLCYADTVYRPIVLLEVRQMRDDQAIPLLKALGENLAIVPLLSSMVSQLPYVETFTKELLWQGVRSRNRKR